jgi:RNA polymerase sigma-70 factor, ECF subfamily
MGDSSLATFESPAPQGPNLNKADADARMRRLVSEHYDFVWRVLRRLGVPPALAEDATQDVFIIVDKKTQEFWPVSEKSYLFAVAARVAAEKRRAERNPTEHLSSDAWSELADASPGPDAELDDRRARAVIDQILELIPFDQRVVFVLFELEDMTMQEIGEALGLPSGTVASRLRRAREVFQHAVRKIRARAGFRGAK